MYRTFCVFFAALVLSLSAQAVELKDFYSATVPVVDRQKESFEQGLRDALVQVLMKTSARPAEMIQAEPRLALDLSRGEQFAEQFSFSRSKVVDAESGEEVEQLYLKASFPEKTVMDLLQKGGLRLWPNNRPATLLWPVVKTLGVPRFALTDAEEDLQILVALQAEADKHGIPVSFPEIDAEAPPSLNQFWLWNQQALKRESAAYSHDAIVALRIAETGDGRVLGGWQVQHAGSTVSTDLNAESMEQFIQQGFDWLAQHWARQYGVKLMTAENETLVVISNIDSHQKYEAVVQYLEAIEIVEKVYLLEMKKQQLELAVSLKTQVEQFHRVLSRDGRLMQQAAVEAGQYQRHYHWVTQ